MLSGVGWLFTQTFFFKLPKHHDASPLAFGAGIKLINLHLMFMVEQQASGFVSNL